MNCNVLCGFFLYERGVVETILHGLGEVEGISLFFANPLIEVYVNRDAEYYVIPSRLNGYALVCNNRGCSRLYGLLKRCTSCEKVYGLDFCLMACADESSIENLKSWFVERSLNLLSSGWSFEAGCSIGPTVPADFLDHLRVSSAQNILWFKRINAKEVIINMESVKVFRFWRLFRALTVNISDERREAVTVYARIMQEPKIVRSFEGVVERLKAIVEAIRDYASKTSLSLYIPTVEIIRRRRQTRVDIEVNEVRDEEVVEKTSVYLDGLEKFFSWAEEQGPAIASETRLVVES